MRLIKKNHTNWLMYGAMFSFCLIFALCILTEDIFATPAVSATSYVVMDYDSGEIVLEKNRDLRLYPASITKIVPTIMAIEQLNLDEIVTTSPYAAEKEGTSLFLEAGEKIKVEDLLYALMLQSANDGAVAIGEHIAGSEEEFAKKMTQYVTQLGTKNTQFKNASGLHHKEHYTSAYDMALITRHAMRNPLFVKVASSVTYDLPPELWKPILNEQGRFYSTRLGLKWDNQPKLVNHFSFLTKYDNALGVKNGYTRQARNTVVAAATKEQRTLIVAILKAASPVAATQDAITLLNQGFDSLQNTNLPSSIQSGQSAKSYFISHQELSLDEIEHQLSPIVAINFSADFEKMRSEARIKMMVVTFFSCSIVLVGIFLIVKRRREKRRQTLQRYY